MFQVIDPTKAAQPSPRVSKSYTFIPTTTLLDAMESIGFEPTKTTFTRTRSEERNGFQKHIVRFRPTDHTKEIRVGDSVAEIVMHNAHDLSSSLKLLAGIYRFVCSNGAVVSEAAFPGVNLRHQGNLDYIMSQVLSVVERMPHLVELVARMKETMLEDMVRNDFARRAVNLRWPGPNKPVLGEDLLRLHRSDDRGADLWSAFNVVQENLIKGGMMGVQAGGRISTIRPILGASTEAEVNTKLWDLAMEYA